MPAIRTREATNAPGDMLLWRCGTCDQPRRWSQGCPCGGQLTDRGVVAVARDFDDNAWVLLAASGSGRSSTFLEITCPACGQDTIGVHVERTRDGFRFTRVECDFPRRGRGCGWTGEAIHLDELR